VLDLLFKADNRDCFKKVGGCHAICLHIAAPVPAELY
jgi:hypothetical protein